MLPILQIGPLAIQLPGLLVLAGIWLGTNAIERQSVRLQLPIAPIQNMILLGLMTGVIGARLGYAARYLDVYLEDPAGLVSLQTATLSPEVGALVGLIVCWIYGRRRQLDLWPTLDAMAPGLAVFALSVGFAHLASGDAFGAPTRLPWAIELWGASRHPSQVYEIIAAGIVLTAVLQVGRIALFPGAAFLSWVVMACLSRLMLEAFRGDSVLILGGLRQAQVLALAVLLLALIALHHLAQSGVAPRDSKMG
jgi:phosphatidylglycerol:prolipoprotein diacylglycerol transferase